MKWQGAQEQLPALLVIHGTAERRTERVAAKAGKPRTVQRGARYPTTIADYFKDGRLIQTHGEIDQLAHA